MGLPSRPAGKWVRMVIYMNEDTKEASNDFWFHPGDGFTLDLSAVKSDTHDLVLSYKTALLAVLATSITIRGGYVEWSDGTHVLGIDTYQPANGGLAAPALPEDVAVVVQKLAGDFGAFIRGRWYFSGANTASCNGSYLSAGGEANFDTLATFLEAPAVIGANTLTPYLFSPTRNQFSEIAACEVVALLGTRRRRRGPF